MTGTEKFALCICCVDISNQRTVAGHDEDFFLNDDDDNEAADIVLDNENFDLLNDDAWGTQFSKKKGSGAVSVSGNAGTPATTATTVSTAAATGNTASPKGGKNGPGSGGRGAKPHFFATAHAGNFSISLAPYTPGVTQVL